MEELMCEYKDCGMKKVAEDLDQALKLMEMHERAVHQVKKEKKKEEKKEEKRKDKRAQAKPPKFLET